jgi:serine/threonine protein kinase
MDHSVKSTVTIHSEISEKMDDNHALALERKLKDCTDEQLVAEIARRKLNLHHKITSEYVSQFYDFGPEIGHGSSGDVFMVTKKDTSEVYACKVVEKSGKVLNSIVSINREIQIMKHLRHQNIVSLIEVYESPQCIWLIMEYIQGTGLRQALSSVANYSEAMAARVISHVLLGLHYLHDQGVIHRDIKMDNILVHGDVETGLAKIADFGLAAYQKPGTNGYHINDAYKRKVWKGLTGNVYLNGHSLREERTLASSPQYIARAQLSNICHFLTLQTHIHFVFVFDNIISYVTQLQTCGARLFTSAPR